MEWNVNNSGGSGADTDDERDVNAGQEIDSDEEDNTFFDTSEFLVTEPLPTLSNYSTKDSANFSKAREKSSPNMDRSTDTSVERVGFEYPFVPRRSRLPEPKEEEKSVSLWSVIKDAVGKDLTKICLPVYFNEPISSLQKCFEDLEYSYLLDRAYACGMQVCSNLVSASAWVLCSLWRTITKQKTKAEKHINQIT